MPVNRAFVTGRIQSEILYRVSGFHLFSARFHFTPFPRVRLLSALQSPNLRFSRDFSASSKMKGSLSNLFQRSSCSLSMETGRLFSGTLVSWNAFFLVSLFFILLLFFLFEHVLSTLGAGKWRGDVDFECCAPQGFQFLIV